MPDRQDRIVSWETITREKIRLLHARIRGIVECHVRNGDTISAIATSCYLQGLADAAEVLRKKGIKL